MRSAASWVWSNACALLMADVEAVKRYQLTPRARAIVKASAGAALRLMRIGPKPATQKFLAPTGLNRVEIEAIEFHEVIAAPDIALLRLRDGDKLVSAWGRAIALGHALGASFTRLAPTTVNSLHAT